MGNADALRGMDDVQPNAQRPTVEGAGLDLIRLYNCGCRAQGAAFTSCGRHAAPPTPLTEVVARQSLGVWPIECPGCFQIVRTLAATYAHKLLCAPPGFIDLLLWHRGENITPTLARWVGNSIARMAGAPPTVGRPL